MLTHPTLRSFVAGPLAGALLLLLPSPVPSGDGPVPAISIGAPDAETMSAAVAPDDDDADLPDAGFDVEVPGIPVPVTPVAVRVDTRLQPATVVSSDAAPSRLVRGPPASPAA